MEQKNVAVQISNHGVQSFTPEQVKLLKEQICKGSTNAELQMFIEVASRTGLNPFTKQIYAIKRYDTKLEKDVMSIQVSIDGFRLVAERSNKYQGQTAPQWCGDDGKWVDVWLKSEPPRAARVGVWKDGAREPTYAIARWDAYKQEFKNKKTGAYELSQFWRKMGPEMLSKCAESLALRKAFPQDLSGLYTAEEMAQASHEPAVDVTPEKKAIEAQVIPMSETAPKKEGVLPEATSSKTERVIKLKDAFKGLGIDIFSIEHYFDKPIANFTDGDFRSASALYSDLKLGKVTAEQVFAGTVK